MGANGIPEEGEGLQAGGGSHALEEDLGCSSAVLLPLQQHAKGMGINDLKISELCSEQATQAVGASCLY